MENFKVGDVVILKSGGPDMTVLSVDGVECQWKDVDGTVNTHTFHDVMLVKGGEEN